MHSKGNSQACATCRTYFDNWMSSHDYDEDHERRVRLNFYRYCKACDPYKRKRN